MAPEKKRRNKRKSRTAEVSSASSSSENESDSVVSDVAPEPEPKKQKQSKPKTKSMPTEDSAAANEHVSVPERKVNKSSDQAFEEFYLRQAAQEFANDLDKLRSAGDFSAKSVPMLIAALKQGSACFGAEEKARVAGAVKG
ncbi:uncharacterized protein RCC_04529 [Ramularia collo-cygni]|uniref:Ribosome assembly protein 3 n=1 Tax=Ramularia collo-cygni TaxID=112498 RepID=A0A2D3UWN0_9PEZI|nr:uncharacterized protein RCC_04529 [Ramularia collo-cygni]CZT18685.1 uncharacterized protein RCC_04529 [Ramularia collo-cygni]